MAITEVFSKEVGGKAVGKVACKAITFGVAGTKTVLCCSGYRLWTMKERKKEKNGGWGNM
jgi:hypothetical protein